MRFVWVVEQQNPNGSWEPTETVGFFKQLALRDIAKFAKMHGGIYSYRAVKYVPAKKSKEQE